MSSYSAPDMTNLVRQYLARTLSVHDLSEVHNLMRVRTYKIRTVMICTRNKVLYSDC